MREASKANINVATIKIASTTTPNLKLRETKDLNGLLPTNSIYRLILAFSK